jgi:hypothetical protein
MMFSFPICLSKLSPFVLFLLAIVLSVLLRFTDSDYPFGIFKLLFYIHHLLLRSKVLFIDTLEIRLLGSHWDNAL